MQIAAVYYTKKDRTSISVTNAATPRKTASAFFGGSGMVGNS